MTKKSIRAGSQADALFTSRARVEVLRLLFLNAAQRFYLREVAARTGLPVRAVQREVARLTASGLVTCHAEGNRKYYQANREAPVFPEIQSLLLKTVGIGDLLRDRLRDASAEIDLAFVFGSYAKGEDTATSDLDLMIIGNIAGRAISTLLKPVKAGMRREINPVVYSESEFRHKAAEGNHFLLTVMREPKIFLIGGEDDLVRLAG